MPHVPEQLPTLHFREALEIAGAPADEPDLAPAHERALGEWAKAEHGSDFVVVHGYPTAHRAFYSHPDPEDPHWSRSFDLIFRGLELVSGAQRLHRYDDYVRTLEERGYPYAPYASYVEAFRRGIPPHGGFAIGLERWVGPAHRRRQHPRGHALPPRPAPAGALTADPSETGSGQR